MHYFSILSYLNIYKDKKRVFFSYRVMNNSRYKEDNCINFIDT